MSSWTYSGVVAVGLLLGCSAEAVTTVWKGGTNDWFNTNMWTSGDYPRAGDNVIITNANANVLLTNATEALSSLVVSNRTGTSTLTFSNWNTILTVTDITIGSNGVVTLPAAFTTSQMSNNVYIVATNLLVDNGGSINVSSSGYAGQPASYTPAYGYGPGGGQATDAGAGYGGVGGNGSTLKTGGVAYGSASFPVDPGSGGGASSSGASQGGAGGGAVRLEIANRITINGMIAANGGIPGGNYGGGGSGGGIYIHCKTIAGTNGMIQANGGSKTSFANSGGGGGGRVAILFDVAAQGLQPRPTVQISAKRGLGSFQAGEFGTIYMTDNLLLPETMSAAWTGRLLGFSSWSPDTLTVSNTWVIFAESGFAFRATNGLGVVAGGRLDATNAAISCGGSFTLNGGTSVLYGASTVVPTVSVGGSLVMTNGAALSAYAGITAAASNAGFLVSVTGDVIVASNSVIYPYSHPTNGGSVRFVISNLTVLAGGSINADTNGYLGGLRTANPAGFGFGGSPVADSGGGYGGSGGLGASKTTNGLPYGSASMPIQPGSGGGASDSGDAPGGAGGGVVWVEAKGVARVDGVITANGGTGGYNYGGGGSGGGIYVSCDSFTGSGGLLQASGGRGGPVTAGSGGGGGGRIAVVYNPGSQAVQSRPDVRFSALYGIGILNNGTIGTLYFSDPQVLSTSTTLVNGIVSGFVTGSVPRMTLTNSWVVFPGTATVFTVSNDLVLIGSRFEITNSTLNCGGNLLLTNGASLYVYSGPTAVASNYASYVGVGGTLTVGTNTQVQVFSDPVTGLSPFFSVGSLALLTNAQINADSRGYVGTTTNGFGTGYGTWRAAGGGGGGYGGAGGQGGGAAGGIAYGSVTNPVDAGSSGGGGNGPGWLGGNGGGAVRITATGSVLIEGIISANGTNGIMYGGGGAGGTVNIIANSIAGINGLVAAKGGNGVGSNGGGGGGGGRVAFSARSDSFSGTISVTNGGFSAGGSAGVTGTICRVIRTDNSFILTVAGDPLRHGVSTPYDYGPSAVTVGSTVTNSVNSPADQSVDTRYVCLGYALSNAAGSVSTGGGTQVVFTATTNLFLTWFWTNQFYLDITANTNGGLQQDKSGWYTNGDVVSMTPVPSNGFYFLQWTGPGVATNGYTANPLTVAMNQPRIIRAQFASNTPASLTWSGTGAWFTAGNWSPPGIPGTADTVTIPSGRCVLDYPVTVASLTVSNAALVLSNWNTTLTVANTIWIKTNGLMTTPSAFRDTQMSNRVHLVSRDLTVDAGGRIDVSSNGFAGGVHIDHENGWGPQGGAHDAGGGYGGSGGIGYFGSAGGSTYGSSNAPVDPGSGGGYDSSAWVDGGHGGGAIWVEVSGVINLNGTMTANGGTPAGNYGGGGSGGSIYLSCGRFSGSGGTLSAKGGNGSLAFPANNATGGGGGGRIAVWRVRDDSAIVTNVIGGTGVRSNGVPGTVVFGLLYDAGTVYLLR